MDSSLKSARMAALTHQLVLASNAAVDLQLHTTYSDGTWTPAQLIEYLVSEQFALAAITDHDRLDSVSFVLQLGAERGLPLLAAVEMSTSWRGEATDVLCYGLTPEKPGWDDLLLLAQSVVRRQNQITHEVYEKLLRAGYGFPREQEVLKEKVGEPLGQTIWACYCCTTATALGPAQ
ncbi:MAG: PHP domain-containing protein [Chloroflexota bacterium]